MKRTALVLGVFVALGLFGCKDLPIGGVTGGDEVLAKYDRWLAHVDELKASVEDAQTWVVDAPKQLAVTLGLPETATLEEIGAAIKEKIQTGVISVGGSVTVVVNVDAGASAQAEAGPEGASAQAEAHASVEVIITVEGGVTVSPEVQQVIDAVKLCIQRVAGIKPRMEAVLANLETVLTEGRDLLVQLPNDLQGILAAQLVSYTDRFNGALEFLGGLGGSLGGTIEVSVNVQVTVTAGVSGQ